LLLAAGARRWHSTTCAHSGVVAGIVRNTPRSSQTDHFSAGGVEASGVGVVTGEKDAACVGISTVFRRGSGQNGNGIAWTRPAFEPGISRGARLGTSTGWSAMGGGDDMACNTIGGDAGRAKGDGAVGGKV